MQTTYTKYKKIAPISALSILLLATIIALITHILLTQQSQSTTTSRLHTREAAQLRKMVAAQQHVDAKQNYQAPLLLPAIAEKDAEAAVVVSWGQPYTAYATGLAYVRALPSTNGPQVDTLNAGIAITIYGTANGEALDSGPTWYRISDAQSPSRYVYGGLVSTVPLAANNNTAPSGPGVSVGPGKEIIINVTQQWMYVYQDGQQVLSTAVATGRPGLDTPIGFFHVFVKESPTTFYSIWPVGSPNYFPPTHINYALEFASGGYFIHDSTWRYDYGPGADVAHYVPGYGYETGSHGCVNVPLGTMSWLYGWADIGTTVLVTY